MEKQKLKEKSNVGALSVRNTKKNLPNCAQKENKGITLVALIITIIVLLILAVVAIRAVQGDGIIQHAKNASNETKIAQEKEQIGLAVNEWQIQKNYPTNGDTFYSFMDKKLKDVAEEIEDNGDGSITVMMQNTGNIYTIQEDGTITGPDVIKTENLSSLEKYFLGIDGKGRSLGVIMPEGTFVSIDEVKEIKGEEIDFVGSAIKSSNTAIFYISYEGEKYKFAVNLAEQTKGLYGLKKLENPAEESEVGKYVNYNGETWIILYDDTINGLQMISAKSLQYNGADFNLGNNDSLINLDSLSTDFEKSVYSYNNAIATLNTACESFVKAEDMKTDSNPTGKITSVRSVGSNPTNKNSENATPYESENLSKWPTGSTAGIGNKKGKSTDTNYESDYDRMVALGIGKCNDNYWLASRIVFEDSSEVLFRIHYGFDDGHSFVTSLWSVDESETYGTYSGQGLRPVVSLKSDISFSGSGTAEDPYTF